MVIRSAPTSRRWSGCASGFLRLAVPLRAPVFAPNGPDAGPGAWSFGSGSPTPETAERQRRDLSGSWGILLCICRVLRPRQDRHVRTYDGVGAAPVLATTKAPANLPSFEAPSHGLCTRCLRFALGIAPPGRKTRFPLLSALRDGIGYPQDSSERFPSCFLHLFLLSQAFLTQCQPNGRHRLVDAKTFSRTGNSSPLSVRPAAVPCVADLDSLAGATPQHSHHTLIGAPRQLRPPDAPRLRNAATLPNPEIRGCPDGLPSKRQAVLALRTTVTGGLAAYVKQACSNCPFCAQPKKSFHGRQNCG